MKEQQQVQKQDLKSCLPWNSPINERTPPTTIITSILPVSEQQQNIDTDHEKPNEQQQQYLKQRISTETFRNNSEEQYFCNSTLLKNPKIASPSSFSPCSSVSSYEHAIYSPSASVEFRRLSDPIHKFIELPKSIWRIVDTPCFQRLRYIKQLGITRFVFHAANHTRFEHCLGVAHLAWTYLDAIANNHGRAFCEMGLRNESHFDKVKLLVTLAGLVHDLGHGPFSHMFEGLFLPNLQETTWTHEQGSCMMLTYLLDQPESEFHTRPISYKSASFVVKTDLPVVFDMIQGLTKREWEEKYGENREMYPKWVFDIVSNKTTTIDVDKFDYLKRDPATLKITHEFSYEILFRETRIVNASELSYNSKTHDLIYDIFHIRYKLFKQVYLHPVSAGIELMLADALVHASQVYDFLAIIRDPNRYLHLTDSIIESIASNSDSRLEESKRLINRIYNRELYRFVGEVIIDYKSTLSNEEIIEGIQAHMPNIDSTREKENVRELKKAIAVSISKLNYSSGDSDPVSKVLFFKSASPFEARVLATQTTSLLRPSKFAEKSIRIFVRNQHDFAFIARVKAGFKEFAKQVLKKESTAYEKISNKQYHNDTSSLKSNSSSNDEPVITKRFFLSSDEFQSRNILHFHSKVQEISHRSYSPSSDLTSQQSQSKSQEQSQLQSPSHSQSLSPSVSAQQEIYFNK